MRRRASGLVVSALGAASLMARCASGPGHEDVRVTHDRALVRSCVDLAQVHTDVEASAAETDLKRQTAELGGNVLLVYNEHTGGAFYCNAPPPEVTISAPLGGVRTQTPRF